MRVSELFATDNVILNHGQVTWMAPELPPSPNYHTNGFNVHRSPTRLVFNSIGLELVTRPATIRYLDHSATAATDHMQS
ncbi:hypothetical protein TNCV_4735471 [Trichonephila clavipes]|nr:hypothetical protein TNCV_4735471 [Trichonephila clavipes]